MRSVAAVAPDHVGADAGAIAADELDRGGAGPELELDLVGVLVGQRRQTLGVTHERAAEQPAARRARLAGRGGRGRAGQGIDREPQAARELAPDSARYPGHQATRSLAGLARRVG